LDNLRQQDPAPDAAGLEPSSEPVAQVQAPTDEAGGVLPRDLIRLNRPATYGSILLLAMPTLAEQFMSAAIGLTDTIVAGHTGVGGQEHAAASAAVGAMTYFQWFGALMTSALGVGATAIVARSIGAGKPKMASRVAGTACAAAFLVGVVIAALFWLFPHQTVQIFGLRGLAADLGARYLRIMAITMCFQTAGQIGMACLRGAGDMFRPMLVTLATTLANCIATPALSFGWFGLPAMGIEGNATGTLLAFAAAGILTTAFLLSGTAGLKLRARHFRIIPSLLKRVLRIGVPSWAEGLLLWGGQALIVIFAINPTDKAVGLDGATLAAHSATLRIESLAFLPGFGFGIACSAMVGQYLGAKKPEEAARAAKLSGRLAFVTMTAAALPMVLFPQLMLPYMVDSEKVIKTGIVPLIIAGLAQPGFAISIIKSSALKGAGETVAPMLATITGMILRIVLVIVLLEAFNRMGHAEWGLIAVWICIFVDLNYRAVFNTVAFRRGGWKVKRV
jgi:putative MATE family efflux protein